MPSFFDDFDLTDFWEQSEYANTYQDAPLDDVMISLVEQRLGYKLPGSYIALLSRQNGGLPRKANHRTAEPTSWASDHVAITGIFAIGRSKRYSLLGKCGSKFWIREWGYPPIGIYFADCPSGGHDMLCLDYRTCGPVGEPTVVHIDQEFEYKVTPVASSFEAFIRGLEGDDAFERAVPE